MRIDHYKFGSITIDGKNYNHDVILFPEEVQSEWWREEGHLFQLQDLEEILDKFKAKTLIIGIGHSGCMKIAENVAPACKERGIKLIAKMTTEATEEFNQIDDKTQLVAALHLTC